MPTKQAFPQTPSRKVFGHRLRVALYARVSTHDQQTLPLQIRALRDYAAKRGWTIVAQIKEVGSGASQRELQLPKAATGIQGLDEITGGGLPRGRPTLVSGGAGSGKTLFGLEFLVRGATLYSEPGVFMSFEETFPDTSASFRSRISWNPHISVGAIFIPSPSPVQLARPATR